MHGPPRDYFLNRLFVSIDATLCVGCTACIQYCPLKDVLEVGGDGKVYVAESGYCAGCLKCLDRCPTQAISFRTLQR